MADMRNWEWYEIAYCERLDAYENKIPAEWFILNAPYPSKEEAERIQAKRREDLKGTDAEWPEANETAKIVHRDELGEYGLKPLNNGEQTVTPEEPETAWWWSDADNGASEYIDEEGSK
jgi:hypothetical protein